MRHLFALLLTVATCCGQGFGRSLAFQGAAAVRPTAGGGGGGSVTIGATVTSTNDTTRDWSPLTHTVDSGTDLLLVFVGGWAGSGNEVELAFEGGSAATVAGCWITNSGTGYQLGVLQPADTGFTAYESMCIYALTNPPTGAGTIYFKTNGTTVNFTSGAHFVAANVLNTAGIRGQLDVTTASANTTATMDISSGSTDLVIALKLSDDTSVTHESGAGAVYAMSIFNTQAVGVYTNAGAAGTKTISMSTADYPGIFGLSLLPE